MRRHTKSVPILREQLTSTTNTLQSLGILTCLVRKITDASTYYLSFLGSFFFLP
ncbi:hypothetical protein CEB3_c43360 [Peptococcaceae bacterium CEB3]|nr:hypothetical protein CEB3_c43360 [Peptococcaceae bacterium CEB3]